MKRSKCLFHWEHRLVYAAKVLIRDENKASAAAVQNWTIVRLLSSGHSCGRKLRRECVEKGNLVFLCGAMDEMNYGKKGSCFVQFMIFLIIFVILLIWVYNKNSHLTF